MTSIVKVDYRGAAAPKINFLEVTVNNNFLFFRYVVHNTHGTKVFIEGNYNRSTKI